ncbi:MAG: CoA pyrophosphatase [Leptospiraceae bacterium]|nr:CoA pyrophosphatase [Leptospiraceae bacterium]
MLFNFEKLKTHSSKRITPPEPRKYSSVVVPLIQKEEKIYLLLTKRNSNLKHHPGQISFPGGMCDMGEELIDTAKREWEEELGVSSSNLEFICELDSIDTFTGFIIHPFLAFHHGSLEFQLSMEEVETVILLDLKELERIPFFAIEHPRNKEELVYYFYLNGETFWGATCAITVRLLYQFSSFQRKPNIVLPNLRIPPFLDLSKLV